MPRRVIDELLKLNGLGFKGKMLIIEKEKSSPKAKNINRVNQNIYPQTQTSQLDSDPEKTLASQPLQRIQNSYRKTIIHKKLDISLFSDRITRGMNIKEINRQIQGGRIHVKAFPGKHQHWKNMVIMRSSYMLALMITSYPNMTS